jgi:hypothetical protein
MRSLLVLWLVVCAAGVAQAQQPSQAFTEEFQKGTDAYRLGKFDEARTHLEAAKKIDPKLPGPWRFLAAVAQAEEKYAECVESAREAIRLNPTSSSIAETRALHDGCRKSLAKPGYDGTYEVGQGALSVTTDQVGAAVEIGGLKYGSTPLAPRAFSVGEIDVSVEKPGYLKATRKIYVLPEVVTDVDFVLEVDPNYAGGQLDIPKEVTHGWVKVETTVPSAVITIDGKPPKVDDQGRFEVDQGQHTVEVTAPGHEPVTKKVRITKGQLVTVKADLRSQASVDSTNKLGNVFVYSGVGLVVVGAVTGMLSLKASDTARDWWVIETTRPPGIDTSDVEPVHTRANIEKKVDQAKRYALISNISYGAAVVAIGVGAYFLVKGRPRAEKKEKMMTIVPLVGDGGIGAAAIGEVRW